MKTELVLRFDYGRLVPWVRRVGGDLCAVSGPDAVCLRSSVPVHGQGLKTEGEFTIKEGEIASFVLTWHPSHQEPHEPPHAGGALERTLTWWRDWCSRLRYQGAWADEVLRSLIMLKALTYAPTGGIVAAPTTSLPGGDRRRPQLGLPLLLAARRGLHPVRAADARLPERRAPGAIGCSARSPATRPKLQIMYGLGGRAAADRVRDRLAARLRGLAPGAHRQRRRRPVPARRLRRGHRRAPPGATSRVCTPDDDSVGACSGTLVEFVETDWRRARRGHLGGARAAPPLHPLEGDGVGGVGPRGARRSRVRARRAGRALARGCATRSTTMSATQGFDADAQHVHPVLRLEGARRQPADDPAGRLPARRRPAHASARSTRSANGS